jgi:crotonobetainyl-CoA:carnitine CoA-transferase CaiB-like acyl-CoA transferase
MTAEAPLAGIRVLDFSQIMAGPHCTRLLADAGAEVIKLEPLGGDQMRQRAPLREGRSTYYGQLNCGKRSVAVDLRKDDGRDIACAIAARSDVVVENFRPGAMARLGLDYDTLAKLKPDLVYCSISGFGQTGPAADRPAYAPMINAGSGHDLVHMRYQDNADKPPNSAIFVPDVLGGTYAFGAIQTALIHKFRTGRGQYIDVSLTEAAVGVLIHELQDAQFPSEKPRFAYGPSRAADGYVMVPPFTERNFHALTKTIGRPKIMEDPRFSSAAARAAHWKELMALVEAWTSQRTMAECEKILLEAGCPCSAYREISDALSDPQLAHRGFIAEAQDGAGSFRVAGSPYTFSEGTVRIGSYVADLGADARDVLADVLGWDEERIDELVRAGVLGGV